MDEYREFPNRPLLSSINHHPTVLSWNNNTRLTYRYQALSG